MNTILITMAGRGQRFRDAGHDRPKYEIEVHGKTLFQWSMESLSAWFDEPCQLVLVARAEDEAGPFTAREAERLGLKSTLVELDTTTDGQATTAMQAANMIADPAAPLAIYNIDTHVTSGVMDPRQARGAGWIPCFQAPGDHWSFAAVNAEGRVTEVREKRRISPFATLGLYWFDSFDRYADLYSRHFAAGGDEAGERYVAPMYNRLIADGELVSISEVAFSDVTPLGTPAEVERFQAAGSPHRADARR
ncbi:MAG: glycosyltransferase family 2 protein [Solirubrobacteraceae bacterium]|nr:glycosyltransferase family 2 protein [Solirubrobacteraceae bacterium]